MFEFLEKIKGKKLLETPLEKIEFMISQRDELPFKNLPYDVFEKICGNVLFSFLGFYEGENLLPEKRWELFMEKIYNFTIEKDFARLVWENRLFELSVLLDIDETDIINWRFLRENGVEVIEEWNLSTFSAVYGYLDVIKLLHEKHRRFSTGAMDGASSQGHFDIVVWLHENRTEGCTDDASKFAAKNGYYELVSWLHENNKISHTIVNNFERLCVENRVLEISLLLDRDETDEIFYQPWEKSIPLSTMACFYGKLEIVKILHEKK